MQVSWRRCKLVMNASVFFFFLYSQTRMWFVYVCDTVWPVTAVSLPGFLQFFFVFFVVVPLWDRNYETLQASISYLCLLCSGPCKRQRGTETPSAFSFACLLPFSTAWFRVSSDFMSRWRFQNNRILSTYLRAWNHRPNVSDFLSLWEKT